jgi:hypothetical protein
LIQKLILPDSIVAIFIPQPLRGDFCNTICPIADIYGRTAV